MIILTGMAVPMVRISCSGSASRSCAWTLWTLRDAIDRYKAAADQDMFQTKLGSDNYPPDLETLVKGVDVAGKKLKYLRKVPIDPMTGKASGECAPCRTIRPRIHGASRTSSMSTPSRQAKLWTARSIRTGR